jgi:hypothetical protein
MACTLTAMLLHEARGDICEHWGEVGESAVTELRDRFLALAKEYSSPGDRWLVDGAVSEYGAELRASADADGEAPPPSRDTEGPPDGQVGP